MAHRQANILITQAGLAPRSVVNRYASRIRPSGSRTTTTWIGRKPSTVGQTASYVSARNDRGQPYTTTDTDSHTHAPTVVRFRSALAAASFGLGKRGPF